MRTDDHDDREDKDETELATPAALSEPDEKTFWSTYSPRFEMPISYTGSALIIASFVGLLAVILYLSTYFGKESPGAVMSMVDGGDDAFGAGKAGDGGVENPITIGQNTPTPEDIANILPTPDLTLPEVTENLRKDLKLDDLNAQIPIASENAAALAALDKQLRDKLLGIGQQKGSGGRNVKGDGGDGPGDGGTGADSTRARSLRWIMRFKTTNGRDYLNQLSALGAEVLVPLATDPKNSHIFRDLANPKPGTMATDSDFARLAGKIQFSDYTKKSVREMRDALGLDFTPRLFLAFFPKKLEEEMQRMEKGFRNRRSEDIEETVFEVIVRDGKPQIFVADQKLKK
jgi:hypothetical protein